MTMQMVPYAVAGVPIAGTAAEHGQLNDAQKNLIVTTLGKGCPKEDLDLFFWTCEKYQLNPFGVAQVYAVPRNDRVQDEHGEWVDRRRLVTQVGINGLTLIAERSGRFEGVGQPEWCGPLRSPDDEPRWRNAWLFDDIPPAAARVKVWKTGSREPTWGVAMWSEWAQWGTNRKTKEKYLIGLWATKPAHMLAKCATAIALRRAFQQEFAELRASFEPSLDDNPRARISDLYVAEPEAIEATARPSVSNAEDRPLFVHEVIPHVQREPEAEPPQPRQANGVRRITDPQRRTLFASLGEETLRAVAMERFGLEHIHELSVSQANELVEDVKAGRLRKRASQPAAVEVDRVLANEYGDAEPLEDGGEQGALLAVEPERMRPEEVRRGNH